MAASPPEKEDMNKPPSGLPMAQDKLLMIADN